MINFKKTFKKTFSVLTVLAVIFSSLGPVIMNTPTAQAAMVTTVTDMTGGFMRLSQGGDFYAPALQITIGSNENAKTLAAITVSFAASNGTTPTWTASAATSSELLNLAATNGGVSLWEETNSISGLQFWGTPDTQVTLAANPIYGASNIFTLTPDGTCGTTCVLATGNVFYVALRPDGSGVTNGNAFTVTLPANGIATTSASPTVTAVTTLPIIMENQPASIMPNPYGVTGAAGNALINVRFNKPVQKVGGGALVAASFTYADGGGTAQTISSVAHNPGQDFATLTMSGVLDAEDFASGLASVAAVSNAIADMSGSILGTNAVEIANPLDITTQSIPSTIVGTVYNTGTPLITFAAAGGTVGAGYTWAAATAGDGTILTNLGLSLVASGADAGKLTGTIANIPGSYPVNIKVTDSATPTPGTWTKFFNINVAPSGGGGIPGITSVTPGGGPKGAATMPITIAGVNTNFSASSKVQFLLSGVEDTKICVAGGCAPTSAIAANIILSVNIAADATEGPRDVKITTGSEQVMMPNGFGVFASGGSGLNLTFPADAATGVQMPPNFNFDPSVNAGINSYRISLNTTSNFSGTTLWDYVFPKPADVNNSNNSHCNSFGCNTGYGEGRFMILTPPTPLAPNTTYYWRARTYAESPSSAISSATAIESTAVRSFTTTNSMSDVEPPMVMHRPIFQATANADLNVIARVMDNLATAATTPALATSLLYCAGTACNPTTSVSGTLLGAGYYKYIIPSAAIGTAGTIVRYYISATDGTNTRAFKQPDGTNPFQLTSVAAGSASSITGNVKDMATPTPNNLAGAYVFADGTGFLSSATGDDGNFVLGAGNTLFAGTYDLIAFKSGYGDPMNGGIPAGTTGIQFTLGQGFGGGFGGDTSKPMVKFTGPMDGMNGIPGNDTNFKIFVAFNKEMSQSKFAEAENMLVKKITNFSINPPTTVNIDGSWTYYSASPGLPMLPPEGNMAVFSPTVVFGDNKTILVSITSNITDTAGNSIQSNQSDGSYSFMFTTGSTATFSGGALVGGGTFGTGAFMPPHVTGTMPPPGSFDVPRNSKVIINFSDPMADDGGGYLLKNNVKLFTVASGAETDVTSGAIDTVVLDSTKTSATVTLLGSYNSGTFVASAIYRLKVLGGAKAASGMTISPPDQTANAMFTAEFKTGAVSDTAAPNIVGSYPSAGDTNTPVNTGAINVGFSKDMDMSTITVSTVYLSIGATAVNGTVEYRGVERQAFFVPKSALNPNTTYTINVTTGVKGINNVAIAATAAQPLTRNFTTGAADAASPEIMFMNADDYAAAITFSEPMNTAKATDSLNWPASVLNPAVYNVIEYGAAGFTAGTGAAVSLASATLKYDAASNTLMIEGLKKELTGLPLVSGQELYLSMDVTGVPASGAQIAKDLSGNGIAAPKNAARSPINSSANTKGALGPMAMGGSAFDMGGGFMPTNFSANTFGFAPPVDVKPFNMMAGKTTIYGARLPVSLQIPASGAVVLTFPTGFDVSGAKQDINSPMRADLNGPGAGTPTFKCQTAAGGTSCSGAANADDTGVAQGGLADDGVVVNTSARTVTVYLSAATNAEGHDFLTIDIDGIKNSTVPKDFNTSGYTVDIKTKKADGTVVESLTSMPFFIQTAGSYTLSGTVTATGATGGTMKVYLGSPMTGPIEATSSAFAANSATYSFTNLLAGDYMLFTDQSVALTGGEFIGKSMPERIVISEAADTANSGANDDTIPYNFSVNGAAASGIAVAVSITGPANEPIDVFASSPTGFRVKQITLNGSGSGSATLYLSDGQWFLGAGPQMPKGPMSGPPPAPSYMPPKPKDVKVTNPNCVVDGAANAGCSTAVAITLATSTKTIKGLVKDGSDKVMASAEVYAYSPNGGFGTHAQTDSAGAFTLNVADGSYIVGAFLPGMPSSKEVPVTVTSHAATYLLIDGAATAIAPVAAESSFILKVAKPGYTISGKITDGTNVVQGASVYAYKTNGPGNVNANTNSSGQYTLYVSDGIWNVGSFIPQYGQLTEQSVIISTASASNINFSPSQTGTYGAVSGTVMSGGSAAQGAFVKISGNGRFNETQTGADGTYSFNVPEGDNCYRVRAFIPGVGETASSDLFSVTSAGVTGKNITVVSPKTVTFTFSASVSEAFIDAFSSTGIGNHIRISNSATGAMSLPNGDYKIQVGMPGTPIGLTDISGAGYSGATGILTVDGAESLAITLPPLRVITGTVTDGTNNIANAWVEIVNPTTGIHFGTMTNTTTPGTNFSFRAADGTYFINAMKPGYFREPSQIVINDATVVQTLTISTAEKTISGQILIGAAGAANAFVRAEKQGGGFAGTQADATGNYTLYVNSGVWKVLAVAEGYAEAAYASNPIDMITASTATGKNIALSTAVSLGAPSSKPITPSSGGTLEDTASGVKLTIPANALGSSTSAGNIQSKETNNVRETGSAKPVMKFDSANSSYVQAAKEITATDSNGNPITNLSSDVTVEMTYTKAELANTNSASDSSINTKAEADALKMAYWDETTSNWVTKPTALTYKNSSGNVITDATTIDTEAEFSLNVATVVISASTDHFSLYAPVVSTDPSAPSTPLGLAATPINSSLINLSWTQLTGATSYDIYRNTAATGTFTRIGNEPTVASGSTTAYADSTGLSPSTAYYYKITALNVSGESAASSAVTATTPAGGSAAPSGGGGGDVTPPGDATNITAAISLGQVVLSWTKPTNSDFSSIRIYRSTVSGTRGNLLTSGIIGAAYTDNAVTNGTTYYYTIHAVDTSGNENTSTAQISAVPGTPTVAPTPTPTPTPLAPSNVEGTPNPEAPGTTAPAAITYPDGTLLKTSDAPEVYVIKSGNKVWVASAEEFNASGYKWEDIKVVTGEVLKSVGSVKLIRVDGDPRVYVLRNNKKTHIKSAEEFNAAGYKWENIVLVSKTEADSYAEGNAVSGKIIVINPDWLRVRRSNTVNSAELSKVNKNETYSALEENNGWYKIQTAKGITGWVSGTYVTIKTESAAISGSGSTIIINVPVLRIRSLNSASGKILGLVKKGAVFSLLEENSGWHKIKTDSGITGWVSGQYATKK